MLDNKLEQNILSLYDQNLVNLFSINQISKNLKKKYPYINKKVTEFLKQGIMKKIVVGRSYLCSLNLNNPKTIFMLSMLELKKSKPKQYDEILSFIENNSLQLSILSVIVYSGQTLFIVNDIKDRRSIQRTFSNALVVDKNGLLDMLTTDEKLFCEHKVVYGFENFFGLIRLELDELKRLYSPLRY